MNDLPSILTIAGQVGILDDSQALYKMLFPMSELHSIQVGATISGVNLEEWKLHTIYISIYNRVCNLYIYPHLVHFYGFHIDVNTRNKSGMTWFGNGISTFSLTLFTGSTKPLQVSIWMFPKIGVGPQNGW